MLVASLEPSERLCRLNEALYLPATVDLEVSSACDRRCQMCPREAIHRGPGILQDNLVDTLVDWLPTDARVMFCGLGEPLLHPDLPGVARRLRGKHRVLGVTTHGQRLFPPLVDALLDAGLGLFQVSLHAADSAKVQAIAPSTDLSATLRNVEYLARHAPSSVRVAITATLEPGDQKGASSLHALSRDLGVGWFPRYLHHRGGALNGGPHSSEVRRSLGCGSFARCTFITWQGDVLACCNDLSGSTRLGGVEETPYTEILARKARLIEAGNFFPACATCDDTYRHLLLLVPRLLDGEST